MSCIYTKALFKRSILPYSINILIDVQITTESSIVIYTVVSMILNKIP